MSRKAQYSIQYSPGAHIADRYVIRRLLGEGGYGVVYEAEQLSTGQSVAIKLLRPQPDYSDEQREELLARFHREIRLMGQLHHPNSIRLVDSGVTAEGARFVVLEFLRGQDLQATLKANGPLEPRQAHRIVCAVLEALAEAHEYGIVHRDIKPANIMLTGSLKRPAVKVLDFGIATIQEGFRSENYKQLTMAGQTRGTPAYMAPEQLQRNEVSARSDIYSTGLVLLECLMGRRAVAGSNAIEVCLKQLDRQIDFPDTVRRGPFGDIIARAIAYDPTERYQSADEMLSDLERIDVSGLIDISTLEDEPDSADDDDEGAPTVAMAAVPVHPDFADHAPAKPPVAREQRTMVLDPETLGEALEQDAPPRVVDDGVETQALPQLDSGTVPAVANEAHHRATTAPIPQMTRTPDGSLATGAMLEPARPIRPASSSAKVVLIALIVLLLVAVAVFAVLYLGLLG